jgi:tetratricopeptide (TPR) repeat protein
MDIESFWEYSDPSASENRFRAALEAASGDERLELLTQIARTYSLRGRFEEAHRVLDDIGPQLTSAGYPPKVRYELERGRAYNSTGMIEKAQAHFQAAWEIARNAGLEGLAVDAAHMLAITYSGQPEALDWTNRGLAIARASREAKAGALIPAMLNNAAWDLHDQGRVQEALLLFEEALTEWTSTGKDAQIKIARWSVARCLRSLGQFEQALSIQLELESARPLTGISSGFVNEEIGENLWALGRLDLAKTYFRRAVEELSRDDWLVQNEPERLNELKSRAE